MFYHMYGKDVNSLKIYHRDSVGGKLSEIKTILGKTSYGVFSIHSLTNAVKIVLASLTIQDSRFRVKIQQNPDEDLCSKC